MDELAYELEKILTEESLKPAGDRPLTNRMAQRIAAYVLGNYIRMDYAVEAVIQARTEELESTANILLLAVSQRGIGAKILHHLDQRLSDVALQRARTKEDNT